MVLVVTRRRMVICGYVERQPKVLKGELENDSRKPKDLVGKLAE
jgi:hypothetical protein